MKLTDLHFTLGAADIEMNRIEAVLKFLNIDHAFAGFCHDESSEMIRCVPSNAMEFTCWLDHKRYGKKDPEYKLLYSVKCDFAKEEDYFDFVITPNSLLDKDSVKNYFENSTIGQVWSILHDLLDDNEKHLLVKAFNSDGNLLMIAAGAWCPAHAYKGLCPGIRPDEFLQHRAEVKAGYQNRPVNEMKQRITNAAKTIKLLPVSKIGDCEFRKAGDIFIPQLPDGAQLVGEAVEYQSVERHTRRKKIGLIGALDPNLIDLWMETHKGQLKDMYGDRTRGFAGGYVV